MSDQSKDPQATGKLADYYQILVQSMEEGFCVLEMIPGAQGEPADFRYLETNGAFERQSGMRGVVGRRLTEMVPDVGKDWARSCAHVALTGEPLRLKNMAAPVDQHYDLTITRIGGAGSGRVGMLFRNVTERTRREQSLRRSEERYRRLFESLDEGFCIIEVIWDGQDRPIDYRFREVNSSFERQTGLRDAVGKTARELVAGVQREWLETYANVARTGEPVRFQRESVSLGRWYDVYAFRIDEAGEVALLFNDISGRVEAERRLIEADRRKDEFLAMLAHELRNPLAPIAAAAEILDHVHGDEARLKRATSVIRRQVHHMTDLVDELLDVSRVTRGLVTLQKVPVDAKRIVSEALEQARPLIEARRHKLGVHLPAEPCVVYGDPTRLVQVLANILNNAAKYTPEGGEIGLTMRVGGSQLEIAVTDNGIGIAPEFMPKVFDLFAQAERPMDRSQGGLGIGLALVKTLVQMHGGRVQVASAGRGRGTTFTLQLPLHQGAEAQRAAPVAAARATGRRLKVVVVDDNVDAAETLAMVIESMGHEVVAETSSVRAWQTSAAQPADVYLLDVGLPDLSGHELAQRLRAQPQTAKAVLVAVTGYGQAQDRDAALAAGFDHHFVKPVPIAVIEALLEQIATAPSAS